MANAKMNKKQVRSTWNAVLVIARNMVTYTPNKSKSWMVSTKLNQVKKDANAPASQITSFSELQGMRNMYVSSTDRMSMITNMFRDTLSDSAIPSRRTLTSQCIKLIVVKPIVIKRATFAAGLNSTVEFVLEQLPESPQLL